MSLRDETITVTTSAALWLAAIDELGWRTAKGRNINWPQVVSLIESVQRDPTWEHQRWDILVELEGGSPQ